MVDAWEGVRFFPFIARTWDAECQWGGGAKRKERSGGPRKTKGGQESEEVKGDEKGSKTWYRRGSLNATEEEGAKNEVSATAREEQERPRRSDTVSPWSTWTARRGGAHAHSAGDAARPAICKAGTKPGRERGVVGCGTHRPPVRGGFQAEPGPRVRVLTTSCCWLLVRATVCLCLWVQYVTVWRAAWPATFERVGEGVWQGRP